MIDPLQTQVYTFLPPKIIQLSIHLPKNLNEIINLSDLLLKINSTSQRRAQLFCGFIISIYSLQSIYICIKIIVFKNDVSDIGGGPLFIIMSFYDLFVIMAYTIMVIIYGAEANLVDQKIRQILNELERESIEAKTLCDQGLVYQKYGAKMDENNIFIIR